MCRFIQSIPTATKFVILMHPKEFRKTKNGTGMFTHLSLENSLMYVGIDFSNHKAINQMIENPHNNCFVLYPNENSIVLNETDIYEDEKETIIFIIDSTWPCSKKMLAMSQNINNLPKVSFTHTQSSQFKIKTQPHQYCLSTIESTLCVLELLQKKGRENLSRTQLENFLLPFEKMVSYQLDCVEKPRFLKRRENLHS